MNGILTVPFESKWYHLLVVSEGKVDVLPFHELEEVVGPTWDYAISPVLGDHIVHPRAAQRYAARKGLGMDPLAFELLVARWVLEWPGMSTVAEGMFDDE